MKAFSPIALTVWTLLVAPVTAFCPALTSRPTTHLSDKNLQRDIEERSRRNAQGGAGETVAGAVLGSLLFGPFGKCVPRWVVPIDASKMISHTHHAQELSLEHPSDPVLGPKTLSTALANRNWNDSALLKKCWTRPKTWDSPWNEVSKV